MASDKIIICVGRESGSGGRKIAEKVAKVLNIPYYDKELIAIAAKNSGLCEEILTTHDEKPTRSFLYSLVMDTYSLGFHSNPVDMPMEQKVFLAQYNTIKSIAEKGSCVIVGRCADYALEDDPDMISVFICGDEEDKIAHVMETYELPRDKAKDFIDKTDKRRSNYYDYYSNKEWGVASSYDFCLNSSVLGHEGTAQAIVELVKIRQHAKRRAQQES